MAIPGTQATHEAHGLVRFDNGWGAAGIRPSCTSGVQRWITSLRSAADQSV